MRKCVSRIIYTLPYMLGSGSPNGNTENQKMMSSRNGGAAVHRNASVASANSVTTTSATSSAAIAHSEIAKLM